mmetsp:Transcript_21882/g.52912  ORF Transcript_21882/g.52912 Transcript_21882/m.52912 type:complete len:160 (-) Transcript_21882:148-627(-)
MHCPDESSENDTGPDLPSGVLRSRGGWADSNNLEIEHQRERLRAAGADEHDDAATEGKAHAAVDLSQFRNEEVGKGYQAKCVVRQREASSSATGVVDMSGGKFSKKKRSSASKKRSRNDEDEGEDNRKSCHPDVRLGSYLKCKGMRDFMKELDKVLKEK